MILDILAAAIRVLKREGARRFTTARVAEVAGVSVGSLYQYFPNKEALLFRLQQEEWEATLRLLDDILGTKSVSGPERLRLAVNAFFRTEAEEAALRRALDDAGILFRHLLQTKAHEEKVRTRVQAFFRELMPASIEAECEFRAEFIMTALAAITEKVTGRAECMRDINRWAEEIGEMFCIYLAHAPSGILSPE